MLTHIAIQNFAIIEQVELELTHGLTVLTGETGAGKSILIDALNLTLGDRASADVVRHGAEKSDITATFDIRTHNAAKNWLNEQDFDVDDEVMLRRVINKEGRSRAYINGSPTQLGQLKKLGEMLIDIHGQHEHQSLVKTEKQRALLDRHGQHADISELYRHWREVEQQWQALSDAATNRDAELDLLTFQVQELEALGLQPGEAASLDIEHQRLANAGDTIEQIQLALQALYEAEEQSAHSLISDASRRVENCDDPDLNEINDGLQDSLALLQEHANGLRHYLDRLDIDPARLAEVEERLALMHALARKHQIAAETLPNKTDELRERLNQLSNAEFALEKLSTERQSALTAYTKAAEALSNTRQQTAQDLSRAITEVMQTLGMPQGEFSISVEYAANQPSAHGSDRIEFLVAANPGQPAKPLGKVASGGELARISLAIQVITASASDIPSMIFDEVDTGVGGGVAEIVGTTLRQLGEQRQALCVTHLPQVAAQGHHHLKVAKSVTEQQTSTELLPLTAQERIDEIARMLGGVKITEQTLAHAAEMLNT